MTLEKLTPIHDPICMARGSRHLSTFTRKIVQCSFYSSFWRKSGFPEQIMDLVKYLHFLRGTWYLLIYLSRYLDQKTAKWHLRSSQAATCYYQSNHSTVAR